MLGLRSDVNLLHYACMKSLNVPLIILLATAPLVAQDRDSSSSPFTLNVNVDLVELHVTVLDDKERTIGGLNKDHFKIFENKALQPISVFKHEDRPVSLGLVVDNSRSIEP